MIRFFHEPGPLSKASLGNKGVGLCEMAQMGVSVPPGFILPIELQKAEPQDVYQAVREGVGELERLTGQRFGYS